MSVKILHFADAHIDSYSGGRIDPSNGLPVHTNDFLKALDEIIDTAIAEKVQLVLLPVTLTAARYPSRLFSANGSGASSAFPPPASRS